MEIQKNLKIYREIHCDSNTNCNKDAKSTRFCETIHGNARFVFPDKREGRKENSQSLPTKKQCWLSSINGTRE